MQLLLTFLTVIAWAVAIVATPLGLVRLWLHIDYNSDNSVATLRRMLDQAQGFRKMYYPSRWLIPAGIAWAWIITGWIVS